MNYKKIIRKAALLCCCTMVLNICAEPLEASGAADREDKTYTKVSKNERDRYYSDSAFVGNSVSKGLNIYFKTSGKGVCGKPVMLVQGCYSFANDANPKSPYQIHYRGRRYKAKDAIAASKVKRVFINMGSNDLWKPSSQTYQDYVRYIQGIRKRNPGIVVFIQGTTPMCDARNRKYLNNSAIRDLNKRIEKYCSQCRDMYYVDVSKGLKTASGGLQRKYSSDGYVHMTMSGYKIWAENLNDYVSGLLLQEKNAAAAVRHAEEEKTEKTYNTAEKQVEKLERSTVRQKLKKRLGKIKKKIGKQEKPTPKASPTPRTSPTPQAGTVTQVSPLPQDPEAPQVSPTPQEGALPQTGLHSRQKQKVREAEIPAGTEVPGWSPGPTVVPTLEPTGSLKPLVSPKPTGSPKPSATPSSGPGKKVSALHKVSGVKLVRYSANAVKVTWKKHGKAKYYRVYYSAEKEKKAHCAGVTKNTHYLVKKLKNGKTYHFYVTACKKEKPSREDSGPSAKVSIKMRDYVHKTIFAGDSICEGVAGYGKAFPQMHMGGKKKVIAYRGLNTVTFHTKRIFKGRTGLQKLIAEKPYRVYMMLGINEIHYRKASDMIAEYKGMIEEVKRASPGTDIVLCALSPVTRAEKARHSGYWQIPVFNGKLKKLAQQTGTHYFDYTGFLKDSGGYLKAGYAAGDGYHWKPPAYAIFGKLVNKYEKLLDQ